MGKVIRYSFLIEATSPVYFGGSERGKVALDAEQKPLIFGNAVGGALREYLQQTDISGDLILKYMGGVAKDNHFWESAVYISDAKVESQPNILLKEGTAIEPAYGTAKDKHKYTLEYLPEGTTLWFQIECNEWSRRSGAEVEKLCPNELEKLIGTWANGLETHRLLLGGQKSNGFGRFKIVKLEKVVFDFTSIDLLHKYLTGKTGQESLLDWKQLEHYLFKESQIITFSLNGNFPYGVYQAFTRTGSLTGLQEKNDSYFIPSTSIRGLIRNEVLFLLKRMITSEDQAQRKCTELFGGMEQKGKLTFSDVIIENAQKVKVERCTKKSEGGTAELAKTPAYIKIDRLTGSVYNSALKHQEEIQGEATIQFYLTLDTQDMYLNPYIFPLIYVLRRLGAGSIPIGGRTVIGLGQFFASSLHVTGSNFSHDIEIEASLSEWNKAWLKEHFEEFKRWCLDDNNQSV